MDLPGLARVPVGDQPSDIEERIRRMILEYIRHPTCLILAVSPSNADLVNSDSISMARAVDPDGSRTIGGPCHRLPVPHARPRLQRSACAVVQALQPGRSASVTQK